MTARTLVVVSAGLSQPSSTRLLADRLADATATALRGHGTEVTTRVIELRDLAHELTNNLLTGFADDTLRRRQRFSDGCRRRDRSDADLQRLLQRSVQDVLRCA